METTRTVLVVDEADVSEAISGLLRRRGYEVITAADGLEAERIAADILPDLAVIGALLSGQSGFRLATAIKIQSDGRMPVILTSANGSSAHRDYAFAVGADAFFACPISPSEVLDAVATLCPMVRVTARPVALAAAS